MKTRISILLLILSLYTQAQVKIGNNPGTIDANSLLELESTNKGFLPPRVALNSSASVAPLTGTVPSGMLVYSVGGTLPDGFYYWNNAQWKLVATTKLNVVPKTTTATLTKTENCVLASNDIILTLPIITASDDGMEINVKNEGSHTDLVTVKGNSGATIDDRDSSNLTKHCGQTFIASGGNWIIKDKSTRAENLLDVSANSSWATLQEVVEYLELHMTAPTVVRLAEESYDISSTITVDLPYALTFQGLSYGASTIAAATGLANKPMFRCISDCYFKMLQFDATSLTNYGTLVGEDAIRLIGSGTYNEVKDCTFDRFYNTILDSADAELWVFETDISNARGSAILVHGNLPGVIVKVAETDFISCNYGINLSKGSLATIQLASGGYYNGVVGDTAIFYQPANFTFTNISITGNSWNNTGKYIEGFDFTLARDKNAIVESNAGMGDKRPNCAVTLLNNTTATSVSSTGSWYKINWDHTKATSTTCKWTIADAAGGIANVNRITYLPTNKRDVYITISGNLLTNSGGATVNIGIVKNASGTSGTTGSITRYGETTLYTSTGLALQFSTVVYLSDISPGDYFELWANSSTSSITVTLSDTQWLVNTQ